jgi:hypothetical protein
MFPFVIAGIIAEGVKIVPYSIMKVGIRSI